LATPANYETVTSFLLRFIVQRLKTRKDACRQLVDSLQSLGIRALCRNDLSSVKHQFDRNSRTNNSKMHTLIYPHRGT